MIKCRLKRLVIESLIVTAVATGFVVVSPMTPAFALTPCGGNPTGSEFVNGQIVNRTTNISVVALNDWNFNEAGVIGPPAPVLGQSPDADAVISDDNRPNSPTYCMTLQAGGGGTPLNADWDGFWASAGCYWSWYFGNPGSGRLSIDLRGISSGAFVRLSAAKSRLLVVDFASCSTPPPPPPWQQNVAKQIKNVYSGLCLVVQGPDDGSQAFMYDCSIPYADQLWTVRPGNGGGLEIANSNSGKCLVTPYWYNFGVTQTYCDIYPDSKWVLMDPGPMTRLKNVYTGNCLVGSTTFYYDATTAPCSTSSDQYWTQR